jgi:hypothetical protein
MGIGASDDVDWTDDRSGGRLPLPETRSMPRDADAVKSLLLNPVEFMRRNLVVVMGSCNNAKGKRSFTLDNYSSRSHVTRTVR